MGGTSLSRWTLSYFAVALVCLVGAQAAMVAGWTYPAVPASAPETLAAVHLLTIGWLTVLILGALLQFVPMVTGLPASNGWRGLLPLPLLGVGLVAMILGFLALGGVVPQPCVAALPLGGCMVLLAAGLGALPLGGALWRARPLTLPIRFVLVGLVFLLATVGLGLVMAFMFACPAAFPWGHLLGDALQAHLAGGILGWFTLTALGVSYRLLAMFILAPDDRGFLGEAAFAATTAGLVLTWAAGLGQVLDLPLLGAATRAGAAVAAIGLVLFLLDLQRLYRARRRRRLELHATTAAAAFSALGAAILLLLGYALGLSDRLIGPAMYLLLFGWLTGLGLGQLYKLVPFLTWLQRFAPLLGRSPVPRLEELVEDRLAAMWFTLYFAAVAGGTLCGLLGWNIVWREAAALHLLATLGISRELWRARRFRPALSSTCQPDGWSPNQPRQQGALS